MNDLDTICAVATPAGHGGIGVVRVSGPMAKEVLSRLWDAIPQASEFEHRRLYLGTLKTLKDKVMAVWMRAPNTYTGEDVVELSCHGSPVVLQQIVSTCVDAGARVAEPGEFTKRAFLAGKMDLAQAEAVCDLINSTSERGARLAAEQLSGRLSDELNSIMEVISDARARVEASIDFPEEGEQFIREEGIAKTLDASNKRIKHLITTFAEGRLISEGVRVAIVGRPNAGKSSILNRLIGCQRALVHDLPGTTRDVVCETVVLGGQAFKLHDTAGVRNSACDVEAMGMELSRRESMAADLIVAVFDSSSQLGKDDEMVMDVIFSRPCVLAVNKCDLRTVLDVEDIRKKIKGGVIRLSALTGEGMDELKKALVKFAKSSHVASEGLYVTNARHREALDKASKKLTEAIEGAKEHRPLELIAEDLRAAHDKLGEITGKVTTDQLLDRIFSRFCIGK